MADSTTLPERIVINGKEYVDAAHATTQVGNPWEQYGAAMTIVGIIALAIVIICAIGFFWPWVSDQPDGSNWRCILFSHRIKHDKVSSANYDNVGTAEVIYCKRCMHQVDIDIKPLKV